MGENRPSWPRITHRTGLSHPLALDGAMKASNVGPLFQLAGTQCGVFTAEQADRLGSNADVRKHLLARGAVQRRSCGLFVVGGAPSGWEQDLWVAWLAAGPCAAIGGRAAARGLGLSGYRAAAVEVVGALDLNHRQPIGRIRRTRWLPADHIVELPGLPPLTSPARTIFDLAGDPDRRLTFRVEPWREAHKKHIGRLISRSLRRDDFTMLAMMRMLAALGRRGRAGTTIVRELVRELGADYEPTESDLEDVFLDLVRSEGIEEPERQVTITTERGWIGRADFRFRKHVIWEVDGPHHDAPLSASRGRGPRRGDASGGLRRPPRPLARTRRGAGAGPKGAQRLVLWVKTGHPGRRSPTERLR